MATQPTTATLVAHTDVRLIRLSYQPPASSTFLSEQSSHQQLANSIKILKNVIIITIKTKHAKGPVA
jgi:hypothetical protein